MNLVPLTVQIKDDTHNVKLSLFVGTVPEAESITSILTHLSRGDTGMARQAQEAPTIYAGSVSISDAAAAGSWTCLWAVLAEKRCLLYKRHGATVPVWSIFVQPGCFQKNGKLGASVRTGLDNYLFRFETEAQRDEWVTKLDSVSQTLKEKIEGDLKQQAAATAAASSAGAAASAATGGAATAGSALTAQTAEASRSLAPIPFTLPLAAAVQSGEATHVLAWGLGSNGQLGNRSKESSLSPVAIEPLAQKKVRHLSAGDTHCAAVTEQGHVYVWGQGEEFQLGLGQSNIQSSSPFLLTSLLKEVIVMVACGRAHTLALTNMGRVFSWGSGLSGQLGLDSAAHSPYPKAIDRFGSHAGYQCVTIAAGGDHSAALAIGATASERQLYTWGSNAEGQLGNGTTENALKPTAIYLGAPTGTISKVSCGGAFTAALMDNGSVYTWGANTRGQLGLGDSLRRTSPVQVSFLQQHSLRVSQIQLGHQHCVCIALTPEKIPVVLTWGAGVTNGFQEDQYAPAQVAVLERAKIVAASGSHTVSINEQLQTYAFGVNAHGELGNGRAKIQALVKVRFPQGSQCLQIACGRHFSLALLRGELPSNFEARMAADPTQRPNPSPQVRAIFQELGQKGEFTLEEAQETIGKLMASFQLDQKQRASGQDSPRAAAGGESGAGVPVAPISIESTPAAAATTTAEPAAAVESSVIAAPATTAPAIEPTAAAAAASTEVSPAVAATTTSDAAVVASASASTTTSTSTTTATATSTATTTTTTTTDVAAEAKAEESGAAAAAAASQEGEEPKKLPLPPNWKKYKDANTGRYYYFNTVTKQTQWKRPLPTPDGLQQP